MRQVRGKVVSGDFLFLNPQSPRFLPSESLKLFPLFSRLTRNLTRLSGERVGVGARPGGLGPRRLRGFRKESLHQGISNQERDASSSHIPFLGVNIRQGANFPQIQSLWQLRPFPHLSSIYSSCSYFFPFVVQGLLSATVKSLLQTRLPPSCHFWIESIDVFRGRPPASLLTFPFLSLFTIPSFPPRCVFASASLLPFALSLLFGFSVSLARCTIPVISFRSLTVSSDEANVSHSHLAFCVSFSRVETACPLSIYLSIYLCFS